MSSTGDTGPDRERGGDVGPGPVAADRPVVDGATTSPDELRAEADELGAPDRRRVEELRADVAATADELSARLDVPARVRAGKDRATADLRAASAEAREHPGVLGAAAVLLVVALLLRRRARRRSRADQ
ncbi:MAG TPA: hypothetical protein VNO83_00900 [Pseudonocardia sp.]|nr:hypothetical protein [Pseudonocardia sp.]